MFHISGERNSPPRPETCGPKLNLPVFSLLSYSPSFLEKLRFYFGSSGTQTQAFVGVWQVTCTPTLLLNPPPQRRGCFFCSLIFIFIFSSLKILTETVSVFFCDSAQTRCVARDGLHSTGNRTSGLRRSRQALHPKLLPSLTFGFLQLVFSAVRSAPSSLPAIKAFLHCTQPEDEQAGIFPW